MENRSEISEILKQYQHNMDRQQELDRLLLKDQSREEWIDALTNRAAENHAMYEENGDLLRKLELFLQKPLDSETALLWYEDVRSMYLDGYDDCEVLLPLLYKLIEYFEEAADTEHLLFLYGAAYYEENEVRNRKEGLKKIDETFNFKVLNCQNQYGQLSSESRVRIWVAYYNLIVVGLGNKVLGADESYCYLTQALAFWSSPEVQKLDGKHDEIRGIVDRIRDEWLIVEEIIETGSPETKAFFCQLAGEIYEKQLQEKQSISDINTEVYAAYLHSLVLSGAADMETIVDRYFTYYERKLASCHVTAETLDDDFYFIINTPLILERWLHFGIPEEKAKQIMKSLKEATRTTWYQNLGKHASSFLNEIMAEWCFTLMKYLDSQSEKEEWIFQLLVRRQLPTYLHSVMVRNLAEAFCREALRSRPELFADLPEECGDDPASFIRQSALLHDVGKTRITDIVNTQSRKLWDREFHGILLHPVYGAEMLGSDSDLAKYSDIALGHHKFYDGTGGYPQSFDNTKSPCRILIDLITICDCIDAATDHLGRNYKKAKELDVVLEELIAGKGLRYNPDLVEILEHSPELQKEIRYIVSDGRLDIMYRAYRESAL